MPNLVAPEGRTFMPVPYAAWQPFIWGSRGLWYFTGVQGVYMSHVFIPNGIRVVLQCEGVSGQQLIQVVHMRSPNAAPDYADCLAAGQVVADWWGSNYRNMVPAGVIGRQVVATGTNAVPAAQATLLLTLPGLRPGAAAPEEISCAIKWFTHTSGRRNRGGQRAFAPVLLDVAGDHFTAAYITALTGVFQNLLNAANTAGFPLVIYSIADVALKVIAGVDIIDDIIDRMGTRKLGVGR